MNKPQENWRDLHDIVGGIANSSEDFDRAFLSVKMFVFYLKRNTFSRKQVLKDM